MHPGPTHATRATWQVHVVATCTHKNVAVLWDAAQARLFNWVWRASHTRAPSSLEGADAAHAMIGRLHDESNTTEGRSAALVLRAMTPNAVACFKQLISHQLDEPNSVGITFSALYTRCRKKLVVSSEAALKGFIAEFTDHHLLKMRAGAGGKQCVYCTLEKETMREIRDG